MTSLENLKPTNNLFFFDKSNKKCLKITVQIEDRIYNNVYYYYITYKKIFSNEIATVLFPLKDIENCKIIVKNELTDNLVNYLLLSQKDFNKSFSNIKDINYRLNIIKAINHL